MKTLELADRKIETSNDAFVMGIVNCTNDSFYVKSRMTANDALKLIDEGADILDIGGESTRPGSKYIGEEEELKRIIPVIKEIRKYSSIPISVDTRKKNVMEQALDAGADILNDISAMEDDNRMVELAADRKIPVILMHKRSTPKDMQSKENTAYRDVFAEVNAYLKERVNVCLENGIKQNKIIVDPGIGFAKNLEQNKILVSRCGELLDGKYPVLMGLSRKSFLGEITGKKTKELLAATLTANLISFQNGATFFRVHDVSSCVDTLAVIKSFRESNLIK